MRVKVLDTKIAGSTLAFSPVPAHELRHREGVLELQHRDNESIAIDDLKLASVFCEIGHEDQRTSLMLFFRGRRRPFLVELDGLAVDDQPTGSTPDGLRSLLRQWLGQNRSLAIDRATYEFLGGATPRDLDRDVVALATALGAALGRAEAPAR